MGNRRPFPRRRTKTRAMAAAAAATCPSRRPPPPSWTTEPRLPPPSCSPRDRAKGSSVCQSLRFQTVSSGGTQGQDAGFTQPRNYSLADPGRELQPFQRREGGGSEINKNHSLTRLLLVALLSYSSYPTYPFPVSLSLSLSFFLSHPDCVIHNAAGMAAAAYDLSQRFPAAGTTNSNADCVISWPYCVLAPGRAAPRRAPP